MPHTRARIMSSDGPYSASCLVVIENESRTTATDDLGSEICVMMVSRVGPPLDGWIRIPRIHMSVNEIRGQVVAH
jgi:hypothetical protein